MSSSEPIVIDLSTTADRPTQKANWKRAFCDAYSDALASGAPPGDATIAKAVEACASRLEYRTGSRCVTIGIVPPSARTLRRWHKALVTCHPRRDASNRSRLSRSAAMTAPS